MVISSFAQSHPFLLYHSSLIISCVLGRGKKGSFSSYIFLFPVTKSLTFLIFSSLETLLQALLGPLVSSNNRINPGKCVMILSSQSSFQHAWTKICFSSLSSIQKQHTGQSLWINYFHNLFNSFLSTGPALLGPSLLGPALHFSPLSFLPAGPAASSLSSGNTSLSSWKHLLTLYLPAGKRGGVKGAMWWLRE